MMDTISNTVAGSLPALAPKADVVVCGGGPSGIMAAVAAARLGARVVLAERMPFLGGMATGGLVNPLSELRKNGRLVIGGLPWEFVQRLAALDGTVTSAPSGNIHFSPETYKLAAQRMLLEAGVTLLLDTCLTGCIVDKGMLESLTLAAAAGTGTLHGRVFVDCTGNAVLARLAGAALQSDCVDAAAGQPASLCFMLGGVDTARLENTFFEHENTKYSNTRIRAVLKAITDEAVPLFGGPWFARTTLPGVVTVNMTRAAVDHNNPLAHSAALCALREDVHTLLRILKASLPEFAGACLLETASLLGVRESRRILGHYTLTGQDVLSGAGFADTVAFTAHPIDIHRPQDSGQDVSFLAAAAAIPYRCLTPQGRGNLLAGGRAVSADSEAFASLRVQGPAMALGQAAGAAAALAAKDSCAVQEVDVPVLQGVLQGFALAGQY